jgi:hypothetical protein
MSILEQIQKYLREPTKDLNIEGSEKSSFFDLNKAETCLHLEHNPPMHLYIPPGKGYKHVCPNCGKVSVIKNQINY